MKAARHCSSWADLQPELLELVLSRLHSLADRVRVAAVCRPWRLIVREEPLLPWLPRLTLLDGSLLSIPGGEVDRMHVPGGVSIHGSVGHWLFLRRVISGELVLMNHFSKLVVRLPMEANASPGGSLLSVKLVPLSTPDLFPDSLFAVLVMTTARECKFSSEISVCRPPSSASAATTFRFRVPSYINDAACFDGKLYALSLGKLFAIEIASSSSRQGNTTISFSSMKRVANAVPDPGTLRRLTEDNVYSGAYVSYLVESRGKLLQVRRLVAELSTLPLGIQEERSRTLSFEVFELRLTARSRRKWRRLYTLGDQALFVGPNSMSLPASQCGAQQDCIYFVSPYDHNDSVAHPLRDSGVFDMKNGRITPLLLQDGALVRPQGRSGCATWFFPTNKVSQIMLGSLN